MILVPDTNEHGSDAARTRLRSTGGEPIGTARRIDALGRVVVPAELRRLLGIKEGDLLDIHVEQGQLVLQRLEPACALCGGRDALRQVHGKHVCGSCVESLVATATTQQ
jgi:transcriptional pleiotropic regulator of transition state genes